MAAIRISRLLFSDPRLSRDFARHTSTIFRLQLTQHPEITIASLSNRAERFFGTFKRGIEESVGLGLRIYWADSNPWAMYGKGSAYFVFRGPLLLDWKRVDEPIIVSGQRVRAIGYNPTFQIPVWNARWFYDQTEANNPYEFPSFGWPTQALFDEGEPAPPGTEAPLRALGYPLPPTDLEEGAVATDEEGTEGSPSSAGPDSVAADGSPCAPVFIVAGLVLDGTRDEDGKPNKLYKATELVVRGFNRRGCAGAVLDANATTRPTIESMLTQLIDAIQVPPFCECAPDQLVIVVTAHIYKPGGINPRTEVAIHYVPGDGSADQWITFAEFSGTLKDNLDIKSIDPKKVFLILIGCNSGDAFAPGRYGKYMPGSLIISACDNLQLAALGKFAYTLGMCLADRTVTSWADLAKCLKDRMKEKFPAEPVPRAGRPKE